MIKLPDLPITVTHDGAVVLLETDEFGFAGGSKGKGSESGILLKIPETPPYLSFHSFAFENSYGDVEGLKNLIQTYYKPMLGKRVYWTSFVERGSTFKLENQTFAVIKLTDILFWTEPDVTASSVEINQAGSVSLN